MSDKEIVIIKKGISKNNITQKYKDDYLSKHTITFKKGTIKKK
jgi:hypothetical protein